MELTINELCVQYNKLQALQGVSFTLKAGEFITVIGANGAGKSTLLRTISGLVKVKSGEIILDGKRIDTKKTDQILRMGIAHVPEGRKIFKPLSVLENLYLGAFTKKDNGLIEEDLNQIFKYFPRLYERKHQRAGSMSGGEQQMLSIGRALMSRPKILLLDEPTLGLSPLVIEEIAEILNKINWNNVSIILVEQNAELALKLSETVYVLETGKISFSGKSKEMFVDERLKEAYLGM